VALLLQITIKFYPTFQYYDFERTWWFHDFERTWWRLF